MNSQVGSSSRPAGLPARSRAARTHATSVAGAAGVASSSESGSSSRHREELSDSGGARAGHGSGGPRAGVWGVRGDYVTVDTAASVLNNENWRAWLVERFRKYECGFLPPEFPKLYDF